MLGEQLSGKLIALDLDGTALGYDGEVADRTVDAVEAAAEAGATFTLATGRDWPAAVEILERLNSVEYALCTNGIEVFQRDGRQLFALEIEPAVTREAIDRLRASIPGVVLGVGWQNQMHIEKGISALVPASVARPQLVEDVRTVVAGGIRDVLVYHPDYAEDVESLYGLCASLLPIAGIDITYSGLPMIELVPPGAGKDSGLAWLSVHVGIKQRNVIAFGDGLNDLAMLRWAGIGVAMGQSAPAVVSAADEVTFSADMHGVAVWLEEHLV